MEKFLHFVNKDSSAREIDEKSSKIFPGNLKVWDYDKIFKNIWISPRVNNLYYWNLIMIIWLFVMDRKVKFCFFNLALAKTCILKFFESDFWLFFSHVLCLIWIFSGVLENSIERSTTDVLERANLISTKCIDMKEYYKFKLFQIFSWRGSFLARFLNIEIKHKENN